MHIKNKENIVKARFHYGSSGMDLTIPSEVIKKANINDGDLFRVTIRNSGEETILEYERIYKSKQS